MNAPTPLPVLTPAEPWPAPAEPHKRLWLVFPVLAILTAVFTYTTFAYYVPAHGGTDQNGYLVTARLLLEEKSLHFVTSSPFQFVGRMMILTPPDDRVFAKYPFGYPLLAAIARKLMGPDGMYFVNPLCQALACFWSFFLFRAVLGNFASLMGVIWMAFNPVALVYANEANSHSPTLLCVVVGMWGLLTWYQKRSWWRGVIGGFALGYACTIRYTEFLLVLPILMTILLMSRLRLKELRIASLVGWAIPIGALSLVLWISFGRPWKTGYSYCDEQSGFSLQYLLEGNPPSFDQPNWGTLLWQFNQTGLVILWGIALFGMILLFWHSWRLALILAAWILPATILYSCYYWAPAGDTSTGYLRFFITVLPGLILCGIYVLERASSISPAARAITLGAITLLATAINMDNISPQLESSVDSRLSLKTIAGKVSEKIPVGSAVFSEESLANYLDELGGRMLYDSSLFNAPSFNGFKNKMGDPDKPTEPDPIQKYRAEKYVALMGVKQPDGSYKVKPQAELDKEQLAIVDGCLTKNQRVFFIFRGSPSRNMLPARPELKAVQVEQFEMPPRAMPEYGSVWRMKWKQGRLQKNTIPADANARKNRTWTIYEIVKNVKTT